MKPLFPKLAMKRLLLCILPMVLSTLAISSGAAPDRPGKQRFSPNIFDAVFGDKDKAPEVTTAELKAALSNPRAVVIDSRPYAEYSVSHIPGALTVRGKAGTTPATYTADVKDILRQVPDRSRPVILYCNGLYCGRSKRSAADLLAAGYTDVRRYQLGIPGWRALGGVTQVEKAALLSLLARDKTAILVDAREPGNNQPPLVGAKTIPLADTTKAKDDGRLPMTDHNTRIFVVGADGAQARAVGEAIVRDAFHNVAFFGGTVADLPSLALPPK